MPAGQGVLAIRDAEETQALTSPTKVVGTVDEETGVISGATLSTPPLVFDTVAVGQPVEVTATFTQVGQGTGLVAATPPAAPDGEEQKGQVTLRTAVKAHLNLKIGSPLILEANCESSAPVDLELRSTGTYTESGGGVIADTNFTLPPVNTTPECISNVSGPVNTLLAGAGHSLSMFIQGDLPVPPLKSTTETALSVDPSEGSIRGSEVTLTAEVTDVDEIPADPTGSVVFKEGIRTLGSAELQPDGTATLTTSDLRSGDRSLTAEYQGDTDFAPSTSPAVAYTIAPAPILTGNFPEELARSAAPVEFDLTVDNSGSPRAVNNGRVDIVVPGFNNNNIVLERQNPDTTWSPVPLTFDFVTSGVLGSLGPPEGVAIPAGAVQTHRLRVSAANSAPIKASSIEFRLILVEPDADPLTLTRSSWPFNVVLAVRAATETTLYVLDTALRPGNTLYVETYVTNTGTGTPAATGQVEFLLDGKVMPFRQDPPNNGPLDPLRTRVPVTDSGSALGKIPLPNDLGTGPHIVTARYLGDRSYLPSTSTQEPLPIIDSLGPLYTCDVVTLYADQYGAYVQAYVRLPSYARDGQDLDLADLEVTVIPGGVITTTTLSILTTMDDYGVQGIEIDLGDAGTIVGDSVAYEPNFGLDENFDPIPSDQLIHLQNLEGTIVVDGEPGDIMPLPIERISMEGKQLIADAGFTFTCTPQGDPVILDEVGVAGVSVAVDSETDPVRVGDDVVLTATVAPAGPFGEVEFFTGSTSLGTASGASGTATLTVDDLPEGANSLSARYTGVAGSPYTSNVVELDVAPAVECAAFAESGAGATVRLVYIELLGRCPDQAGFDYWIGRLAGGTSPEVFARTIAATPEAVGMVVDDAYRTMLGREADSPGKAFWVDRMRSGNGRYDQLLADLGASDEFWRLSGSTRAGFVTRVYEQLLNRAPDAPGLDYWVARLTPGASRRTLILSLANLDEPLGRLVGLSYDEILGRAPSGTERTDGIAVLRRSGDRSGFYAQLIGQPEFSTRAQGFPNPED